MPKAPFKLPVHVDVVAGYEFNELYIRDFYGNSLCDMGDDDECAYIQTAINYHDRLVEALEAYVHSAPGWSPEYEMSEGLLKEIEGDD